MRIFKDLGWFFKEEKWSYIWGVSALLIIALANLVPPILMGNLIDAIGANTLTYASLLWTIVYFIGLAFIVYALRYIWRICIFGASFRLERKVRNSLFVHFTKMSSTFYQEHRVGDLMAHATNDLRAVQRVAGNGVLQLVDALLSGLIVIIAMAVTISWRLTIIALLPMPIMVIGSQILSKKLHSTFMKAQESFSDMNNRTYESVTGIKVTKTFGQEKAEMERFKQETEDVYYKNMEVSKYDAAFEPLIIIVIVLCFIFVFIVGALYINSGEITIGQLITFINYVYLLIWPMIAFGFLYNNVERGNVSYRRINELLRMKPDITSNEQANTTPIKGSIEVALDTYCYPNEEKVVLQDIHFTLQQGQTLGLVGKTGAGKTSLIKLLLREYDSQGKILFDGHDIKEYHLNTLHQALGYVPQDQFLFSTTIENNIRFGNMEATFEEVQAAAKIACIHDDILSFEEQYQTVIGERGVSLSGGQRQRIAIARALLLNPQILVLDDALSAVDAKTEEAILEALKQNRQNKTTVIVAHRLSSIKHAQLILVLENGHIVERGDHPTLINNKGWYAEIFHKQETYKGGEERG